MKNWPLLILLTVAFLIRVYRLNTPPTYMFDEVYHAFTAQAYAQNDPRGYEWWHKAPEGFAYEWLHPPLAKLIQAASIKILGDTAFAWRLPGVIFASATVLILYLFGKSLFKSWFAGLAAAFLYAFDGLSFVQSRITMNDIYLTFFIVLAFYLFWEYTKGKRKLVWLGVALGLAASTKWTGFYAIGILGGVYLIDCAPGFIRGGLAKARPPLVKFLVVFIIIPISIYILSYGQFWLQGHTWQQFRELHQQIWWYQTNLKATHPYQSAAWTWPIMYRPVWYYVNYGKETIANIYATGNPVIWWGGIIAVGWLIVDFVRKAARHEFSHPTLSSSVLQSSHSTQSNLRGGTAVRVGMSKIVATRPFFAYLVVLFGYLGFFLPWLFSPRIMFLYHYLPSIPFMCLALGFGLGKIWEIRVVGMVRGFRITGKGLVLSFLVLSFLVFLYFYPHLSALPVPKWFAESYFWFSSWR